MICVQEVVAKSKKYLHGELLGEHNSRLIGDGYDFAKLKPYEYGENIRRIDPFASAKTGEIYLRNFYESREVNIEVIALMSGSLYFGTKRLKQETVAQIVSTLGLGSIKNSDSFTLSLFSNRLLSRTKKTKKQNGVIAAVQKTLLIDVLNENIDYNELVKFTLKNIKKRSYLFLIGDFLEMPDLKIISKKHEVVVVRVRDSFEDNPVAIGELGVVDPSSGKKSEIIFSKASIKNYKKELMKSDLNFKNHLNECGIRLVQWRN